MKEPLPSETKSRKCATSIVGRAHGIARGMAKKQTICCIRFFVDRAKKCLLKFGFETRVNVDYVVAVFVVTCIFVGPFRKLDELFVVFAWVCFAAWMDFMSRLIVTNYF